MSNDSLHNFAHYRIKEEIMKAELKKTSLVQAKPQVSLKKTRISGCQFPVIVALGYFSLVRVLIEMFKT